MKNDFSIIYRCLHYFNSCEKLQLHEVDQKINDCAIRLPSEGIHKYLLKYYAIYFYLKNNESFFKIYYLSGIYQIN